MTFQTPSSSEKHAFNRASKIKIIKQAFPNVLENRLHKDELIIYCPKHYHHKPKLEINIENDIFNCWVCGFRGAVPKLLREVSKIDLVTLYMSLMGLGRPSDESVSEGVLALPRGVYGGGLSDRQVARLQTQIPITKSDIIKGGVGISDDEQYPDRIVLPSFNRNGKLNYFTTRSFYNDKYKYISCKISSKAIIFNELYINWNKPIVLIESAKTHFKMIDYCNFVPILGSNLHKDSKLLSEMVLNDVPEIVLMFDSDAYKKQLAAAQVMLNLGLNVKCVNKLKFGATQPDELAVDDILDCVAAAQTLESSKDILKMKISQKVL